MYNKSEDAHDKLFITAESQQGYFTAKQAKSAGYNDNTHPYHVRNGDWIRVHRGIYRLNQFPQTERPDLMIWALWTCNRKGQIEGVYSHQTALSIDHLSDIMPDKLHMTVPPSFRRKSSLLFSRRLCHLG
jgi:predicted transcriptional regulator of viral defense system